MRQYQHVTDRICAMLESGVRPWAQDWSAPGGGGRPLRSNGVPYRGMNVLNLWAAAMSRGFASSHWMTYKTAADLGGQVKRGAKSEPIFYVGSITKQVENRAGEIEDATIAFMRCYPGFNADEIEGLPSQFYARPEVRHLNSGERVADVDGWIARTGATVLHGGGRAFYRRSTDEIHLPDFAAFNTPEGYYSTALHELTHWTGAEKRLERDKGKVFADATYAFEELIAELGAAYLCADLRIGAEVREDHASYIKSWLKALRDDSRNIFRAASHAERACGFLHGLASPAADVSDDARMAA